MNTKVARVFTAYDFFAFKQNIEELFEGGISQQDFLTTQTFVDDQYIYFVGDVGNT